MRYKRRQKQIFNIETTQINPPVSFIQRDTKRKRDKPSEGSRKKAATKENNDMLYIKTLQSTFQITITNISTSVSYSLLS